MAPPKLSASTLSPPIAISYAGGSPAIWSVEPIDATWCLGSQFDTLANNIHDGWTCIAVADASTWLGNSGVSQPLRVYVTVQDRRAAPPASTGPPPACTGSTTWPRTPSPPGACTARSYKYSVTELCPLNLFTGTVDCACPARC